MNTPMHHQAGRFKSCRRRIISMKLGIIATIEIMVPSVEMVLLFIETAIMVIKFVMIEAAAPSARPRKK